MKKIHIILLITAIITAIAVIFFIGVPYVNFQITQTVVKSPHAPDTTLEKALIQNQPISKIRDIIKQNPELLLVNISDGSGQNYLPLEYAVRRYRYKATDALTTIHPQTYESELLLRLCSLLTFNAQYSTEGPQYANQCLRILYETTPIDMDPDTYQKQVKELVSDYFLESDITELLP